MIKLVIFDMDGTIADTSPGIYASYKYVSKVFHKEMPTDEELLKYIGGKLPENLSKQYGLSDYEKEIAVNCYREYYSKEGYLGSTLYPHFEELLSELKTRHICISVATLKAEKFANKLIELWGLKAYFTTICGVDDKDSVTKTDMIKKCMCDAKCSVEETVMVGDSHHDFQSALECNIKFIAATYGFYYRVDECKKGNIPFIESPLDLLEVLF